MDQPPKESTRDWRVIAREVVEETDCKRIDDLLYELLTAIEDQILQMHTELDPETLLVDPPAHWIN